FLIESPLPRAPVAQLDRAADFGSAGWGFESLRACSTPLFPATPSTMRYILCTAALLLVPPAARAQELGEEGFADSGGVKIHYVTAGKGPLLILIHGFPDYWYSWRDQMPALAKHFQVVAIDQRGYNKSDQ